MIRDDWPGWNWDGSLYHVSAPVVDTKGVNVDAGGRFRDHYITGPTADAAIDRFRQKCEYFGFDIDGSIDIEPITIMDVMGMLAGDATFAGAVVHPPDHD